VHVVWLILARAARGLRASWDLLWASLYGLTLGFLMSAIVQVVIPQRLLRRYAPGGLRGIAVAAGFGAISSSCLLGGLAMIVVMILVMGAAGMGYATPLNLGMAAFVFTITPPTSMLPTLMGLMGIHLPPSAAGR